MDDPCKNKFEKISLLISIQHLCQFMQKYMGFELTVNTIKQAKRVCANIAKIMEKRDERKLQKWDKSTNMLEKMEEKLKSVYKTTK